MKNCKICKAEIDENKVFCSNRCRQKAYRKRSKVKINIEPNKIEVVKPYTPEYKTQFALYQNCKKNASQIETKISEIKNEIEGIENRNNSFFGRKKVLLTIFGISFSLGFLTYKLIILISRTKRKGIVFLSVFAPIILFTKIFGQKLQNEDDKDYMASRKKIRPLKANLIHFEKLLLGAKESVDIEKMELEKVPKYEILQVQ